MAVKSSGASPDKRRKYDEAFKAKAAAWPAKAAAPRPRPGSWVLLYRWQQA